MFLISLTNFIRNSSVILIIFVMLFYQKDESQKEDKTVLMNQSHQEESLQKRIKIGFSKYSLIRLQQSSNDIRQL